MDEFERKFMIELAEDYCRCKVAIVNISKPYECDKCDKVITYKQ